MLPWVIFGVSNTSVVGYSLALPSESVEAVPFPLKMVLAAPWMSPLNQVPCSHLLLHAIAHHRHSSEDWKESPAATVVTAEGTGSPAGCWGLSARHPLFTDAVGTTGMLSWADLCPPLAEAGQLPGGCRGQCRGSGKPGHCC